MKKVVLLLSLLTLGFVSCEGPMGPPGEGVNRKIIPYTVFDRDWKLAGKAGELGSYYWFEFAERELTTFICEKGIVSGFRKFDDGSQTQLGQVVVVGESDNHGNEFLFTEVYSFSFRPGYITFYVDYSDFETSVRPMTCDFRIVLMY